MLEVLIKDVIPINHEIVQTFVRVLINNNLITIGPNLNHRQNNANIERTIKLKGNNINMFWKFVYGQVAQQSSCMKLCRSKPDISHKSRLNSNFRATKLRVRWLSRWLDRLPFWLMPVQTTLYFWFFSHRTPASLSLRNIKLYIPTSTIHDASPIAFRFADSLDRTVLTKKKRIRAEGGWPLFTKKLQSGFSFSKADVGLFRFF